MEASINYIATHLRRSAQPTKLGELRILGRNAAGEFEDQDLMSRQELIALLQSGEQVYVWDYEAEEPGEAIEVVRVQGDEFLRLDGQSLGADNLGALPEI